MQDLPFLPLPLTPGILLQPAMLQDRLTAVLKHLNADAALLKACLTQYTAWLTRQREAAAALGLPLPAEPGSTQAARDHMAAAGPPAGAFPHKEAVDAWQRLIHKVITAGNWFLLPVRLGLGSRKRRGHALRLGLYGCASCALHTLCCWCGVQLVVICTLDAQL